MEEEAVAVEAKAGAVATVAVQGVAVATVAVQGVAVARAGRGLRRVAAARGLGAKARATEATESGVRFPTPPIRPKRTSERKLLR